MSLVPFRALPDDARLWCFAASRPPDGAETARLLDTVQRFAQEWTAHGHELRVGIEWLHHRFLVIGVDESRAGASGCSLDALLRALHDLGSELNLDLLDSTPVWYRDGERIRRCGRQEFRELGETGHVDSSTPVFDLTLSRAADIRAGRLEVPAGSSWHRSLLGRS
jgi:hypothetical protein